uniref:Uncharacterized protein n=1 Tax=Amazona collaria TaxID=241587 RepID=A0A8B9IY18_9PSIT
SCMCEEFMYWKFISLQDKSEDKKVQSKGKKGPKGKQTEETNQEQTKDNLPAENGEAKTAEVKLSVFFAAKLMQGWKRKVQEPVIVAVAEEMNMPNQSWL